MLKIRKSIQKPMTLLREASPHELFVYENREAPIISQHHMLNYVKKETRDRVIFKNTSPSAQDINELVFTRCDS